MDQVAQRCLTAAAAALAAGGLAGLIATVTPSLPDVEVGDFGLAASLANPVDSQVDIVENHIQQVLGTGGDLTQPQVGLGELLFDRGDGAFNSINDQGFNASDLTPDQTLLNSLAGSGFDLPALLQGPIFVPSLPGSDFNVNSPGGLFGGSNDQEASSAAANVANIANAAMFNLLQALPAAQQAFNSGVASAELAFNNALVDAQSSVVDKFGADSSAADLASWVFGTNNTVVAQGEQTFNNLLGIGLSDGTVENSLLAEFTPGGAAEADWSALTASLSPAEISAVLDANALLLVNDMDLPSYLSSFLLSLF